MKIESAEVFRGVSFLPFTRHLSQNTYLRAVRHSFFAILPFLLAVSFIDILMNLVLNPTGPVMGEVGLNLGKTITGLAGQSYLDDPKIKLLSRCRDMVAVGYGLLSMIFAMSLARRLGEIWKSDTLMTSLCALAAFMFLIPNANDSEMFQYIAGRRFLSAFIVAVVAARIYATVSSWSICKKEPLPSLPKKLSRFFTAALPVSITLITLALISLIAGATLNSFSDYIERTIPDYVYQQPVFAVFYQLTISVLWWFGFPGYGFLTNIQEIAYFPAQASNQMGETSYIFTNGFFDAITLHILALVIAIFVFSNHENWRRIALVSLPCAIFNIQDPIMFCLPVILNPVFLIPYIMAPIANTVLGYIAILWGIVPVFSEAIPWTVPMVLHGILSTGSFMGGALQVVCLVTDIFIYAPFVITANMLEFREEEQ